MVLSHTQGSNERGKIMLQDSHPHFIPDDHSGRRGLTAVLLTGTAKEFGIDQRDIRSTRGGFYITPRMLEALGDETVLALVPDDEDVEVDTGVSLGDAKALNPDAGRLASSDDDGDDGDDGDDDDDGDGDEEPYDPAEDSIDEVKAFVEGDPYTDTVEYIIEQETAGKARKTLLAWLNEFEATERPIEG